MKTELLKVSGMTCGGCARNVVTALNKVSGVSGVRVSLAAGEATVNYDERVTSPDQLKCAVKAAGFGVELADGAAAKGGCCG